MSRGKLDLEDEEAGHQQARQLLGRVALCLKLATIHDLRNEAMQPAIDQLIAAVNDALRDHDALKLQMVGENVYLNHDLIKLDYSSVEASAMLRAIYRRLGVAELSFTGPVDKSELTRFLGAFQTYYRSAAPQQLAAEHFEHVSVRAIDDTQQEDEVAEIDQRHNVLRHYAKLAMAAEECVRSLAAGRPGRLSRLRRAIQSLSEASIGHESLLVGLTRYPNLMGELPYHLAAVTALVLLVTRRLGVSHRVLADACMCALLHDVASDAGADSALNSMLRLCERNLAPQALAYAATAFEHRLPASDRRAAAPSRLVAVVCAFDVLTAPSSAARRVTPDRALRALRDDRERFDPDAVQLLAQTIGVFPVGTAVCLTNGEIGIVMEVSWDPAAYALPRVKIVRDAAGRPADRLLDLSRGGSIRIARAVDALEIGVNAVHYLLA